jgi:hypothetical protein
LNNTRQGNGAQHETGARPVVPPDAKNRERVGIGIYRSDVKINRAALINAGQRSVALYFRNRIVSRIEAISSEHARWAVEPPCGSSRFCIFYSDGIRCMQWSRQIHAETKKQRSEETD